MRSLYLTPALLASAVHAHMAFWNPAMWCLEGVSGSNNENSNDIISPLYQLNKEGGWWFHAYNGCDNFPPPDGTFLELPAGGQVSGEIANNRGFTSLGFNGQYSGEWPDGNAAPVIPTNGDCISSPLLHAHNESDAAGTALAIAYVTELADVTMENLVVFTVAYNTPWKREVSYDVPADMPACPEGGCICAWLWVPNHCGQPNMYMTPHRCKVTGATSTTPVGVAKPPTWCENDESACTTGPKQMIVINQNEGNNIVGINDGYQADGDLKSAGYNMKCGFHDGAQNDIFEGAPSTPKTSTSTKAATSTSSAAYKNVVKTTTLKVTTSTTTHENAKSTSASHKNVAVPSSSHSTTHSASHSTTHTPTHSDHPHTTTKHTTSAHTSSSLPATSAKAGHCSSKSKRSAAKQHLDRHRKKHAGGVAGL